MKKVIKKKVRMELVGEDGNAFAIMARFQRAARNQGWEREEVKEVIDEMMSGDYDNLLQTVIKYTRDEDEDEDEDADYSEQF